jgi:hypothetical protein
MTLHISRILSVLTVAVLGGVSIAYAANYPIRYVAPEDVRMMLAAQVPELSQDCHYDVSLAREPATAGLRGVVNVTCGSSNVQAKVDDAMAGIVALPSTHRFHIVVLTASRSDGPAPDLSQGELKALADFKKVMTFRSFQVEAETVLQSDRDAETQVGPRYSLELSINQNRGSGDTIDVRKFKLRAANMQVAPGGSQNYYPTYIDTSFTLRKGETVVLGTSVSDQQARVVLVTALP